MQHTYTVPVLWLPKFGEHVNGKLADAQVYLLVIQIFNIVHSLSLYLPTHHGTYGSTIVAKDIVNAAVFMIVLFFYLCVTGVVAIQN